MNLNHRTMSNRLFAAVVIGLLVFTFFVSMLPQFSADAQACKFRHTVKQGETLIYIGNLYGVDWLEVAKENKLQPPYTVVAGQVLCIPSGTKPASTPGSQNTGGAPTLQVVPGHNEILVSVENFPKKTGYYVRVFPAHMNVSYRIGHFTTNKDGDFTDWFRMPYYIQRSPNMTLCVKNVWTDAASCVRYGDTFVYYPFVNGRCAGKAGR